MKCQRNTKCTCKSCKKERINSFKGLQLAQKYNEEELTDMFNSIRVPKHYLTPKEKENKGRKDKICDALAWYFFRKEELRDNKLNLILSP